MTSGSAATGREISWPIPKFLKQGNWAASQDVEGFRAEPQFEPVSIPIKWNENPFGDKAWAGRLMCLQAMDAYIINSEYVKAVDILLSWGDYHLVQGGSAYLSWSDMAVGYRALKMSFLLDKLYQRELSLSAEQQDLLMILAESHMQELLRPEKLSHGNHGIFQMYGLAVLAEMFWPLPLAAEALLYANERYEFLVKKQFNSEGVHLEHSAHYHLWMLDELRIINKSGWLYSDYFSRVEPKAEEVKNWLVEPSGHPVRIGDTASFTRWPVPTLPAKPDFYHKGSSVRILKQGGYAIGKGANHQLFLNAAYHSKAHKHADHLHFDWFDLGCRILVDSGAHGYKGGTERAYFLSTRSHNCVEVDGTSYTRDGSDAFGSGLLSVDTDGDYLVFVGQHECHGIRQLRTLRFLPGIELQVIDELCSDRERSYRQWFNFSPEFEYIGERFISKKSKISVSVDHAGGDIAHFHGERSPMNGWRGDGIMKIVPACTFSIHAQGQNLTLKTIFKLSDY